MSTGSMWRGIESQQAVAELGAGRGQPLVGVRAVSSISPIATPNWTSSRVQFARNRSSSV
jgi:hypothetical protein